jgi:dolichyl-phosphate beta-glucosyltransferase
MKEPPASQCLSRRVPAADPAPHIVLVTPVWNDSARLAIYGESLADALAAFPMPVRWIIADDGSDTGEHAALSALREWFSTVHPQVETHFAAAHYGKGSVVREAWALAPDADWLAFVDADGSVSADDMLGLIRHAIRADQSVLGIRKRTDTTTIVESPWRGIAHRGFLLAARLLLDLRCEDPQCGAKVIRGSDYRRIARRLVENGLAFDSELLATLARDGSLWREVPVTWIEKKGGKVKPLRDAWGMLGALMSVRSRME